MVSTFKIAGMCSAIILPLAACIAGIIMSFRKSRKIEAGYYTAMALGTAGYFWTMGILQLLLLALVTTMSKPWHTAMEENTFGWYIFRVLIMTLLASVGLVWALWLGNRHKPSFYRAVACGIGFCLIDLFGYWKAYVQSIYCAVRLNNGTLDELVSKLKDGGKGTLKALEKSLTKAPASDYIFGGIVMICMIGFEIAMCVILAKYLAEKQVKKAFIYALAMNAGYYLISDLADTLNRNMLNESMNSSLVIVIKAVTMLAVTGLMAMQAKKVWMSGIAKGMNKPEDQHKYLM